MCKEIDEKCAKALKVLKASVRSAASSVEMEKDMDSSMLHLFCIQPRFQYRFSSKDNCIVAIILGVV